MKKSKSSGLIERLEAIGGMANIPPSIHQIPVNPPLKLNVLQYGDKKLPHDARIKVFQAGRSSRDQSFSVRLSKDPTKIKVAAGDVFLNAHDLKLVLDHIKHYRTAYIAMWQDADMDQDDLAAAMAELD